MNRRHLIAGICIIPLLRLLGARVPCSDMRLTTLHPQGWVIGDRFTITSDTGEYEVTGVAGNTATFREAP